MMRRVFGTLLGLFLATFPLAACDGDDEGGTGGGTVGTACEQLAARTCELACPCTAQGTVGPDRCQVEAPNRNGGITTFGINASGCAGALEAELCNVPELDDATLDGCRAALGQAACEENPNEAGEFVLYLPPMECAGFFPGGGD